MKKNLLFVSQLMSSGNFIVFGPKDVRVYLSIKMSEKPIMAGRKLNFVYVMSAESAYIQST